MNQKPTIPGVFERFYAYYLRNPEWGVMHVVLSDGNYGDDHVRGAISYAEFEGDHEGAALARILLAMSGTQSGRIAKLCVAREYGRTPMPKWATAKVEP